MRFGVFVAVLAALFTSATVSANFSPVAAQPQKSGRAAPAERAIPVGDPLRRTVLKAVRPLVEAELGVPVQFKVQRLRTAGRYAYFLGESQQPNGRPIDFARTKIKEQVEEGMFDGPRTSAYLERVSDGQWVVRAWQIGSTDYPDPFWPEEFGGPKSLVIGPAR